MRRRYTGVCTFAATRPSSARAGGRAARTSRIARVRELIRRAVRNLLRRMGANERRARCRCRGAEGRCVGECAREPSRAGELIKFPCVCERLSFCVLCALVRLEAPALRRAAPQRQLSEHAIRIRRGREILPRARHMITWDNFSCACSRSNSLPLFRHRLPF